MEEAGLRLAVEKDAIVPSAPIREWGRLSGFHWIARTHCPS
jgi:hypothetical protein